MSNEGYAKHINLRKLSDQYINKHLSNVRQFVCTYYNMRLIWHNVSKVTIQIIYVWSLCMESSQSSYWLANNRSPPPGWPGKVSASFPDRGAHSERICQEVYIAILLCSIYFVVGNKLIICIIQLDWTSCADTHKINLPWDREGYGGFEYTNEKLSTSRIQWWCATNHIFISWRVLLKK